MKFAESHEWIDLEKDVGKVGITVFAQKELGQVVYIELPKVGQKVKAGEEVAVLESTKAAVDIYSPVSGEVLEVNSVLLGQIDLINRVPEGEGWLYKIRLSNPAELQNLLSKEQYECLML